MKTGDKPEYGTLFLIPSTLGESDIGIIPEYVKQTANFIDVFIVENERTARRYLIQLCMKPALANITWEILNKRTNIQEWLDFLNPIFKGKHIGLISEAGCPAIADPGAEIVRLAHEKNIRVVPLVGPSSIFLALMASGMNGQNFAFCGYLPKEQSERIKKIKTLEALSGQSRQTQIFMETPYRNDNLLADIIRVCKESTRLCVAANITLPNEFIKTKTIKEWKKEKLAIQKQPAIFLIDAT